MAAEKIKLDDDGRLQRNSKEEFESLIERIDSLDYKLWEILKIASAFAEANNIEVKKDD